MRVGGWIPGTVNSSGTAGALPNGSGGYDMGARRYGPDPAGFLQQDLYHGALANLGLSLDPLSQNRYALAGGNPVSYVETDGHEVTVNGTGSGSTTPTPSEDAYAQARATFPRRLRRALRERRSRLTQRPRVTA